MLEQILAYLHTDFAKQTLPEQEWTIADGTMDVPGALPGQYVRIVGSVLNDGVYQYPLTGLTDETFTGTVRLLKIEKAVLEMVPEIEAWCEKNQPTAFTSESFGGYSYSRATDSSGVPAGWQKVFDSRLAPYRKMVQH